MSSIRTRLTTTIAVATAVLAGLAVWGGLGLLERDVRSDAIDRQINDVLDLSTSEDLDVGGFGELAESADDDLFEAFGSEVFLVDTIQTLDAAELLDPIVDAFAEDDTLFVVLFSDRLVAVDTNTLDVRDIDVDVLDDDDVIVFQNDLAEVQFALFAPFGLAEDEIEEAQEIVIESVEFDDVIDEELIDAVESRQLETAIVEGVGVPDVGLVVDVTDELAAVESLRAPLWTAAAILVGLAAVATWLLTSRALRPVGAITAQVEEISGGTLHDRVPEPGTSDEIGVLAATMNRMLGRLEESDRRQRQFVSDASHELRTPVSVLRSEANAAQLAPESTTLGRFAEVVDTEAVRLGTMIDDLLYLARSDESTRRSGDEPELGADVDLDDIVLTEAGRARTVPVDRSAVSAGRVRGHSDELTRMVGHLLDNATRHAESAVAVGLTDSGDRVELRVDDDGAGVPTAERARIFERFVRLDEARNRDHGGSGLGLAVVATIVARHGGTIEVSDAPLGGARFTISLPSAA